MSRSREQWDMGWSKRREGKMRLRFGPVMIIALRDAT